MFHIEILLFLPQETEKKVEIVVISNRWSSLPDYRHLPVRLDSQHGAYHEGS